MLLNLSTLRTELANLVKGTAITNDRRDRWLNLAQDDLATELDPENLDFSHTFSSVASQRTYNAPFEFNKIYSVIDTTNDIELTNLTEGELEEQDPDRSDTGTSYYYAQSGLSWVTNQPSSSSVLTMVSSAAGDTTQTVRVNGLDSSSVQATESFALNGVASVVGTTSFSNILQVIKSATTTGNITVTSNAAAVTNVVIPAFLLARQHQPINLYPIPSGVNSYRIRGIRRPWPLVNAQDIPDFPEAYHELVLIGACIRGHLDLFRPTIARNLKLQEWQPKVEKLKGEMGNKRSKYSTVLDSNGRSYPRFNLGSNYPYYDRD
mgnify:CR=1 FL=1